MHLYTYFDLYIQLFGPDDGCFFPEKSKYIHPGQSGSIYFDYSDCECELYENVKGESYLPMELWTDNIVYHDMSFEQDGYQLEMYLDEKEAEKWNKMPTCPNIWINKKIWETKDNNNGMDIHGIKSVSELRDESFDKKKPFYQKNGNDYINLDHRDMVLFLERKDRLDKSYVMIELQEGKILNETIVIKIEVDGTAPDKYYELINGGKGLKITFEHTECLQVYLYVGLVRYVIHTSKPGMLRASFYNPDGENKQLLISMEALAIFDGKLQNALTNNHFTYYWIMHTLPGQSSIAPPPQPITESDPYPLFNTTSSASPPQQPPHESSTKIPSKNGIGLPLAAAQTEESNCDDDGFPLWLLILVIIIDIILAIILILLIIFARRAAATKYKKKTTETVDEPKAAGRTGGKTTEGKTTKFYTVDQTKYYTVDTTFDKSKDEKK
uniref:Uncharacterized protein n=1 Tax=Panagrolaimus davidi TaxID=227884 RepID=A0A914NXL4_9BILA